MSKRSLTPGKVRGLSQCANDHGMFNILALDHRQAVKKVFGELPDPYAEAVRFKQAVVSILSPVSTAVLLDPSIGAGPCVASRALPGKCGLVITVEASGYEGPSHARVSRLPGDWGTEQIKRLGASAVKLLVYYHPKSTTAPAMRDLVAQVSGECQALDVPLFLEILTYSPDPDNAKLSLEGQIDAVVQSAAELTRVGGDILKSEFPVNMILQPDMKQWESACRSLNDASTIPWVLLSAGVDYPVFADQCEAVCKAGASGILAGRAIWKEALEGPVDQRDEFLRTVGRERLQTLENISIKYGKPYTNYFEQASLSEDWYKTYTGF